MSLVLFNLQGLREMKTTSLYKQSRKHAGDVFQRLRCMECADANGVVRCISCGKYLHWSNSHGGHYMPRQHNATYLNKLNVNPQCSSCNSFRREDPAVHARYGEAIDRQWGVGTAERLQIAAKGTLKISATDYWLASEAFWQDILKEAKRLRIDVKTEMAWLCKEHKRLKKRFETKER
jgi:hypothetical protein